MYFPDGCRSSNQFANSSSTDFNSFVFVEYVVAMVLYDPGNVP
jgi:hypothetical protein